MNRTRRQELIDFEAQRIAAHLIKVLDAEVKRSAKTLPDNMALDIAAERAARILAVEANAVAPRGYLDPNKDEVDAQMADAQDIPTDDGGLRKRAALAYASAASDLRDTGSLLYQQLLFCRDECDQLMQRMNRQGWGVVLNSLGELQGRASEVDRLCSVHADERKRVEQLKWVVEGTDETGA